ncbi:MAG TPA: Rne/Rng family ribonuclease [Candidatus Stackebrandtia excrementipullorum]|nr:Rne/Rng family ribonuclease [Candidatus Stackebrandtia excrementipullorum]
MQDEESNQPRVQPAPLLFVAPQAAVPAKGRTESNTDAAGDGTSDKTRTRRRTRTRSSSSGEIPDTPDSTDEGDTDGSAGPRRRTRRRGGTPVASTPEAASAEHDNDDGDDEYDDDGGKGRRGRRGRRGRGRGKGSAAENETTDDGTDSDTGGTDSDSENGVTRRRRRHRKRAGAAETTVESDNGQTEVVVKVRRSRESSGDDVQGLSGSTRLEAKRQRRREGRGQRRARPQVLSESEFLARRESVVRTMVVRGKGNRTQIAVLEDDLLVEHFVTRSGGQGMVGNVYLGKVQNILPSMEAAFIDIGRGRNAVLYAGEVNWDRTGLSGRTRTIEQAMSPGDAVLVQVTKDPVGHKGARLTSHIALSGRHLVYVPHGNASGISRKLPDSERKRLRSTLKKLVPEGAGVIVRTAAEGAGTEDLERDIERLQAEWGKIETGATKGGAPTLLHAEPDLILKVVRDVFNEDFNQIIVDNSEVYDLVHDYLQSVSPDLVSRLKRHTGVADVFAENRVDEQLMKALDRKVFLPSGGSLVIDRTEAMTVVDVNTGKFTGAGGNLEETVTRNNLEAAEEIVRQLRLRDIGGIIVIDFIDMVLESNRDLVLRRLTECLGRDRTKHQVTEITSLGLVQMTRKRVGQGLLEAFSETCEHCKGRGVLVNLEPTDRSGKSEKNGKPDKSPKSEPKSKKKESKAKAKAESDQSKSAAEPTRKIAEASVSANTPGT